MAAPIIYLGAAALVAGLGWLWYDSDKKPKSKEQLQSDDLKAKAEAAAKAQEAAKDAATRAAMEEAARRAEEARKAAEAAMKTAQANTPRDPSGNIQPVIVPAIAVPVPTGRSEVPITYEFPDEPYSRQAIPGTPNVPNPMIVTPDIFTNNLRNQQMALALLGYELGPTGVDGAWGVYTDRAIRQFQKDSAITSDGIAGPITCLKLAQACNNTGITSNAFS
jgi:peptidoglycan hydrolase-like protein with peptidoglycan-binding domain